MYSGVILGIIANVPTHEDTIEPFIAIIYLVIANLFYCLGWIFHINYQFSELMAWRLYVIGIGITLSPVLIAIIINAIA
jgi:hypothetical protein